MTEDRLNWIIKGLDYERLTRWEERFVEACEKGFKKYGGLTPKMEEILENLYREKAHGA
jgi:hypothetical protein